MECSAVTAPVHGRDKKYTPWRAVKTKLGEIEECDWCKLVEAVIERENEVPLLNALIQWCNEHNYVSASVSEMTEGGAPASCFPDLRQSSMDRFYPL